MTPLDPDQRLQIKEIIKEAITAVSKDIVALEQQTRPIAPDNAIGRLSRMEAIGAKSINEAALASARSRLSKLKYALAGADKPEFGLCRECGGSIPVARIMIIPESSLCVECAE